MTSNEVRWNHGTGISLASGSQATLNYVHHNGQKGIGGSGSNNLVEGNMVSFNNWAGFDPTWEAGGMKFAVASNLTVRGNSVHDNIGPGLWTDIGSINVLYENNVVANNTAGPGIQHEISYAATIRNNTVYNNSIPQPSWLWGSQILIQNSQNVQVYGNLVETPAGGGNAIGIIQQYRGAGAYGPYLAINNSVFNNTVNFFNSWGAVGQIGDYNEPQLVQGGNNTFDYNAYHVPNLYGYNWSWGTGGMQWSQFLQTGQEAHGTVDDILPSPQ